jgi:hypothetical protein
MSETERERELDAAWRAVSREEPPAALDDAVRAEARRAVGAAPGARPRHAWRYPAAAAATVALLALGIAQMTSRDEVEPLEKRPTVTPSAPAESAAPAAQAPPATPAAQVQSPQQAIRKDEATPEEPFASPPLAPGAASGTPANAPTAAPKALDELKAKEAGGESVDAWIARIRDLRARGEREAAAKELAAFRAVYGERAEALLPPDLRDGAPQK